MFYYLLTLVMQTCFITVAASCIDDTKCFHVKVHVSLRSSTVLQWDHFNYGRVKATTYQLKCQLAAGGSEYQLLTDLRRQSRFSHAAHLDYWLHMGCNMQTMRCQPCGAKFDSIHTITVSRDVRKTKIGPDLKTKPSKNFTSVQMVFQQKLHAIHNSNQVTKNNFTCI